MKVHTDSEREQFRAAAAANMRIWPTRAEAKLRIDLEPLGFLFQASVNVMAGRCRGYIMDFFHPDAKLCVEVDGGYHRSRKGPDARRDRRLQTAGIRTIRVTNAEVLDKRRYPGVVERIRSALQTGLGASE